MQGHAIFITKKNAVAFLGQKNDHTVIKRNIR